MGFLFLTLSKTIIVFPLPALLNHVASLIMLWLRRAGHMSTSRQSHTENCTALASRQTCACSNANNPQTLPKYLQ